MGGRGVAHHHPTRQDRPRRHARLRRGHWRIGLHAHEWVERLLFITYGDGHSATRIHPEWQELHVGDRVAYSRFNTVEVIARTRGGWLEPLARKVPIVGPLLLLVAALTERGPGELLHPLHGDRDARGHQDARGGEPRASAGICHDARMSEPGRLPSARPPAVSWATLGGRAKAWRVVHASWSVAQLGCLGYIWASALTGRRSRRLWASVTFLVVEGAALVVGRGDCPVGPLQAEWGDPVPFFELVLPPRAAKAAVPMLAVVSVAGIVALVLRRPGLVMRAAPTNGRGPVGAASPRTTSRSSTCQ